MDNYLPTVDELREEQYIYSLSETERELYFLRRDLLDGKIFRMDDERYDPSRTCYENAIGCTLFWAVDRGIITSEESDRLYKKYIA